MDGFQRKYLTEVGCRIQHEGFTVCEERDGLIPVEWAGSRLCTVNGNGGVLYDPEQVRRNGLENALDLVRETVSDTLAYMRQMETAPRLLAEGLSGDYRLLAEHNGTLLAGHQTKYGVEFVTWDRLHDGTLWQGHYFNTGEGNAAAKRDFTVRSGLLPANVLFTREQLVEIYRSIYETLDSPYPITDERKECLRSAAEQIKDAVPDLEERVGLSNQAELLVGMDCPGDGAYTESNLPPARRISTSPPEVSASNRLCQPRRPAEPGISHRSRE